MTFPLNIPSSASLEVPANDNFQSLGWAGLFSRNPETTSGLTFGLHGSAVAKWGGFTVGDQTLTLTNAAANYIVVAVATGVASVSTATTNWTDATNYRRVYKLTTAGGLVTATEDHRGGSNGVHGGSSTAPGGTAPKVLQIAVSDEVTALTAGTAKVTFRMPFAMTLNAGHAGVRASLSTAQATNGAGSIFTANIKESGVTILSTKLTIDNTEKTSVTAVTAPVISDVALADDAEITVDIDLVGDGTAKGLKITLIGT